MDRSERYPSPIEHLMDLKMEYLAYASTSHDPTFVANEVYHDRMDQLREQIADLERTLSPEEKEILDEEFANKKINHLSKYLRKFPQWYNRPT